MHIISTHQKHLLLYQIFGVFIILISLLPLPSKAQSSEESSMHTFLQTRLHEILKSAGQVGNAGIIMHKGNIIAQAQNGKRQHNGETKIHMQDKWHIGSITKSMTATMIGRLVDQGKLDFNMTIAQLWPEQRAHIHKDWHNVTLMHLLNHTSGAPDNFSDKIMIDRELAKAHDRHQARLNALLTTLRTPPKTAPGTAFEYSNLGYTLAGALAAHRLNSSWEELMQEQIFAPLHLKNAGFGAPKGEQPWGHQSQFFIFKKALNPQNIESDNSPIIGPAGIVHMDMQDLARYLNMHLKAHKGDESFLTQATMKKLHTLSALTQDPPYAAGWILLPLSDKNKQSVLFHNGSNTFWYACVFVVPQYDIVMAFATNTGTLMRSELEFIDLMEEVLEKLKG